MSTTAQIEANRANAQSSTGPRSQTGIANCKYNATKSGLTGKQVVINGEDPAEYDALRLQLIEEHVPASEREAMLVEEIAQNHWRLRRARSVETQVLEKFTPLQCILDPEARKAFSTITRYLSSIEKSWRKACTELDKLQEARKKEAVEAAEAAIRRSMMLAHRNSQIGSVSQKPATPPPSSQVEDRKAG